ncbi:hypothetical protein GCM10010321_84050 [Streptomyces chartreusis]|nr:hypothetical protein GCM10010321_84050 [Streptomyces chartreusis]
MHKVVGDDGSLRTRTRLPRDTDGPYASQGQAKQRGRFARYGVKGAVSYTWVV